MIKKLIDSWFEQLSRFWQNRFGLKQTVQNELSFLYPGLPKEERERRYIKKKWKAMAGVGAAVLCVFIICLCLYKGSGEAALQYLREEYGGEDRLITLLLDAEGIQKEVDIQIPAKEITETEASIRLAKAQESLYIAMQALGKLDAIPTFPEEIQGVRVTFYSESPEVLDDSFCLVGDWPQEETNVKILAVFSLEGYTSRAEYEWILTAAKDLSTERKIALLIDKLTRGDYVGETEVDLPTETTEGLQVRWFTKEEGANGLALIVVLLLLIVVFWFYWDELLSKKRNKILEQIRYEIPHFIHELVLLIGAGMSVPNAWFHYSSNKSQLAKEIELTKAAYERGKSFVEALNAFAERVPLKEVSGLCSLLTSGVRLGDASLLRNLKEMNAELWRDKKDRARTKAAGADSKLLIPIMMMLIVILAVVMTPALMNMKQFGG